MGVICCQQPAKLDEDELMIAGKDITLHKHFNTNSILTVNQKSQTQLPALAPSIIKIVEQKKPFDAELKLNQANFKTKHSQSGETYHGILSEKSNKPLGIGKLYRKDGSLLIGSFRDGAVEGKAVYITKDQIFCQGKVTQGKLNCQKGILETNEIRYVGGFKDNLFEGKGIYSSSQMKFNGIYKQGKKVQGKLTWLCENYVYEYDGNFDQDQKFTGTGKLTEPFGSYYGSFINGEKNGRGKYTFNSGLIFQGSYEQGKRSGFGALINKDGSLSYEGEFSNGLPNGQGKSYKEGKIYQSGEFIDGIFKQSL